MYQVAQSIVDTSPTFKHVYAETNQVVVAMLPPFKDSPSTRALPVEHRPWCTTEQTRGKES